jgi:sirohydrochlorin ferrochelatase
MTFPLLMASLLVAGAAHPPPAPPEARPGILLLAHGGNETWNGNVLQLARQIDAEYPIEVAFGMATRANIQAAASRLEARGVTEIVAVPLFISSHSSIVRATEYLLGLRKDAPPELERYAKMAHGPGASGGHDAHAGHGSPVADEGTKPIVTKLPVRMTRALDDHPLLGAIAADRARSISRAPAAEAVILAVHGPVPDDDNELWLRDLRAIAAHLTGYASVDVISLRDDAPAPVREAATAELRALVLERQGERRDVLIVPVLLSYGGIEKGLKTRLEGLDYRIPAQGIAPDARLVEWVKQAARAPQDGPGGI